MKRLIVLLGMVLVVLTITGCNNTSEQEKADNALWKTVVNREFSNWDVWAGTGLYFYEEDDEKYCVYLVYGSGVPVAFHYTSVASIVDGAIKVSLPINMEIDALNSGFDEKELTAVELVVEEGMVKLGDTQYDLNEALKSVDFLD